MPSSRSKSQGSTYTPNLESKRAAISGQSGLFGRHPYLDGRLGLAIGCWDMVVDRQALSRRRVAERFGFLLSKPFQFQDPHTWKQFAIKPPAAAIPYQRPIKPPPDRGGSCVSFQ